MHCILRIWHEYNLKHATFKQFVLLAMLLIPLGWSTISLAHAMEMDPEVHHEHQCQFYDVVSQGVASSLHLEVLPNNAICVQAFTCSVSALPFRALPRSRSPPHNALFL